jgi:hypothetical protein
MRFPREPFIHFILIGTLIFAANALWNNPDDPSGKRVVVNESTVQTITARFAALWKRPPTDQEMRQEIDRYIRREILYREGLALGFDQNDVVVERRVAQKMEFLAADMAEAQPITEAAIRTFYDENPKLFTIPKRFSFRHILFSRERRGARAADDAEDLWQRINSGELQDFQAAADKGDPSLLPRELHDVEVGRISTLFGSDFADGLYQRTQNQGWLSPITSTSYGSHLVEVLRVSEAELPPFEKVRSDVQIELQSQRRRQSNDALYERLKKKYHIVDKTKLSLSDAGGDS